MTDRKKMIEHCAALVEASMLPWTEQTQGDAYERLLDESKELADFITDAVKEFWALHPRHDPREVNHPPTLFLVEDEDVVVEGETEPADFPPTEGTTSVADGAKAILDEFNNDPYTGGEI